MIKSVDTQVPVSSPRRAATPAKPSTETGSVKDTNPPRPAAPQDLAQSIAADGGLSFLRGRLEEKLGSLFDKAAERNPGLAAPKADAYFDTSLDVSPEATAGRIVGFALGFRGMFARQNADLSGDELMSRFESVVRRGIEEGFGDARSILGSLDLLQGDIKANVDATWDLVQQKLDEYFHPARTDGDSDGDSDDA